MIEKKFFMNALGYICDSDVNNTLTLFEVIDILNNLDAEKTDYYCSNEVLREEVQRLEKENEYLKLENEGLKYVLENYKRIDVEVVLDD